MLMDDIKLFSDKSIHLNEPYMPSNPSSVGTVSKNSDDGKYLFFNFCNFLSAQNLVQNLVNRSSLLADDSEDDEEKVAEKAKPVRPLGSKSGAHIHLWQFLKELLETGQQHGSCIRWLDQSRGVFKIEDSVRVARLWGLRKNRPAMNYDKLSRSIRQYYRKGIMRKTERSQRLVYQFIGISFKVSVRLNNGYESNILDL